MKKTYMKPELELIKLETQRMMAASDVSVYSKTATDDAWSKDTKSDMWHWMEEDEQK